MRVGEVIGTVTLAHRLENVAGGRFMIVQPHNAGVIKGEAAPTAEPVVSYDELGAAVGTVVGVSEGREAAMPFHPRLVPVDAYCAAILDEVQIQ